MVLPVTKYKTLDGTLFDTAREADAHEKELAETKNKRRNDYINGYSGSRLLAEFPLTKYGTWRVLGEDSNPGYSGSHHQPYLGTVEGTLDQVIDWAVTHDKFWQWGSGGDIALIEIVKL